MTASPIDEDERTQTLTRGRGFRRMQSSRPEDADEALDAGLMDCCIYMVVRREKFSQETARIVFVPGRFGCKCFISASWVKIA